MRRLMLFDRFDQPMGELAEADVFELTRTEQVNGEHALSITTTRQLEQGQRILLQDDRDIWREYVVYGVDALHDSGERPIGTYYCTWSVQPDLMGTRVSRLPGTETPVTAAIALDAALSGTSRWTRGMVTRTATGGASMYDTDGWDAMSTLVGTWGGELSTTVEVSPLSGVTARRVDLYDKMGDQAAKRRFDFGADLKSVRRIVADGPLYCRITPRGKGEQTDSGGYGRKITIESVNDGKDYLENPAMVELAKLPDGSGGWEYPTLEIENPECETPADLLAWARSVRDDYTLPKVTYQVDVLQLAREGVDMQGVSLGDTIHIVDRKFGGMRLTGRVTSMTVNELSGATSQLTIGHLDNGLSGVLGSLGRRVSQVTKTVQAMNGGTMSPADYLIRLVDRLNAEINGTGGYWYVVPGQGTRTYDKAVSDPAIGAEADSVVEIKGGTIRIANSKTAQGEWDWKLVFVSGHVAAEVVTAANLTAGTISSADGSSTWNLDTGQLVTHGMTANDINATGSMSSSAGSSKVQISGGLLDFYVKRSGEWLDSGLFDTQIVSSSYWNGTEWITKPLPTLRMRSPSNLVHFQINDSEASMGVYRWISEEGGVMGGVAGLRVNSDGSVSIYGNEGINCGGQASPMKNCHIDPDTGGAIGGVTGSYTFLLADNRQVTLNLKRGFVVI